MKSPGRPEEEGGGELGRRVREEVVRSKEESEEDDLREGERKREREREGERESERERFKRVWRAWPGKDCNPV